MEKKIRVLAVDDSALTREALKTVLNSDPDIEVIGEARDGREGVRKALALKPDVITMDISMPIMTGFEAIESIMQKQPIPIIVLSSMDVKVIVKALEIGAMDFVLIVQELDEIAKELVEKVKIASKIKVLRRMKFIGLKKRGLSPVSIQGKAAGEMPSHKVVAIGVSTGGPQALGEILSRLPDKFPASILIVQHISKGFVAGLVEWANPLTVLDVCVAKAADILRPGVIYFAPDDYNFVVGKDNKIELKEDTTKHMLHVPSIDEMMKSVAGSHGKNAIGVIMTGMGHDGIMGIEAIKKAGGRTIAQDEETSVIFGMNKLAIEKGCVDRVVSLENIVDAIVAML